MGAIIFAVASFTDWLMANCPCTRLGDELRKICGPISGQNASDDRFYRLSWSRQSTCLIVAIIVCRELAVTGLRLLLVEHGEVMAAAWPGKNSYPNGCNYFTVH